MPAVAAQRFDGSQWDGPQLDVTAERLPLDAAELRCWVSRERQGSTGTAGIRGNLPLPRRHEAVTTASPAPGTARGLGVVGEMEIGTGPQCHYQTRAQGGLPSCPLARLVAAVCL